MIRWIFCVLAVFGTVYGAPTAVDESALLCEVCHILVQQVKHLIQENKTQQDIINYVDQICSRLPDSDQTPCFSFVNGSSAEIFIKMATALNPQQVCAQLPSVCPSKEILAVPATEEKVEGFVECELCKLAVKGLNKLVEANKTSEEINATLSKLCDSLPAKDAQECHKIEPLILEALGKGVDASLACKFVKLCSVARGDKDGWTEEETIPEERLTEEVPETEEEPESIVEETKQLTDIEEGDDARCELCKVVVSLLNQVLKGNASDQQINATLLNICNALPESLQGLCLTIEPSVMTLLENGFDPTEACQKTNFCPALESGESGSRPNWQECMATVEALDPEHFNEEEADMICSQMVTSRVRRSLTQGDRNKRVEMDWCSACKALVGAADKLAGDGKTVAEVNRTISTICEDLQGETLRQECLSEASGIAELLIKGLNPAKTCIAIQACPPQASSKFRNELESRVPTHFKARPRRHAEIPAEIPSAEKQFMENFEEKAEDGDTVGCELCKAVVQFIDAYLEKNSTDEKLNETIFNLCSQLPGELQDVCYSAAPDIEKAVKSGADPEKACEIVKLCTGSEGVMKHLIEIFEEKAEDSDTVGCGLCKAVVQFIDAFLEKNSTDEKLNETIFNLCSQLPGGLQDVCYSAAPDIEKAVESGADPEKACEFVKLCTGNEVPMIQFTETVAEILEEDQPRDLKCSLCKTLVQLIDADLAKNSTDEKLNETIYKLCDQLPATFKEVCESAAPDILQAVKNGADPETACEFVKLCTGSKDVNQNMEERPAEQLEEQVLPNQLKDLKCQLCEGLINVLDAYLENNKTDEQLNETLYRLCDGLPDVFSDICMSMVPEIVAAAENGLDPSKTCTDIKICTEEVSEPVVFSDVEPEAGPLCAICEFVINVAVQYIQENSSEAEIRYVLQNICNLMPDTIRAECDVFVRNYTEVIVNLLVLNISPDKICATIDLCAVYTVDGQENLEQHPIREGHGSDLLKSDENLEKDSLKCILCLDAVKVLDITLKKNSSDAVINATIYKLCDSLPKVKKELCLLEAPKLFNATKSGFDPEKACVLVNMCNATLNFQELVPLKESRKLGFTEDEEPEADLKCEICEFLCDRLDDLLKENRTEAAINSTIFKICLALPENLSLECQAIAPQLVLELSKGLPPKQACTDIKLCSGKSEMKTDLDHNKTPQECDVCMAAMRDVYDDLSDNYFPIRRHLIDICDKLPDSESNSTPVGEKSLKQKCEKVAESLVPFLVNFIVIPGVFCLNVGACPDNIPPAQDIGYGKN